MTRRSLLWITALAVALGTATWSAAPTGADQDLLWDVTIDTPAQVDRRAIPISGRAGHRLYPLSEVTVTVVRQDPLPPACGGPFSATVPVERDRYDVVIRVPCNGPYQIQVLARGLGEYAPQPRSIGVAERPPTPDRPHERLGAHPQTVYWSPTDDLDAAGWILEVDGQAQELPVETTEAVVPNDGFSHTYALIQMRWGAGGPGSPPELSERSGQMSPQLYTPPLLPDETDPDADSDADPDPVREPDAETPGAGPSGTDPPLGSDPPGSPRTTPPATTAGTSPGLGVAATSTTGPEGYSEELPYGVPDDAFVPGAQPSRPAASGDEETAAGTSSAAAAGLVRTSEKKAPGLVAPLALGLMMITIAAHIGWYLRRSRPPGPGQVPAP